MMNTPWVKWSVLFLSRNGVSSIPARFQKLFKENPRDAVRALIGAGVDIFHSEAQGAKQRSKPLNHPRPPRYPPGKYSFVA